MASGRYSVGVDFGTNSVRALVVDVLTGEELASAVHWYRGGQDGVILDERDPNLARQDPAEYLEGFERAVAGAIAAAAERGGQAGASGGGGFDVSRVVGIGVDTTASTPIPVDAEGTALGLHERFRREPAAMAWLWKDHTSHAEAAEITEKARAAGLPYLAKSGGAYSSEWYWSKALRCERQHPEVARATHSWVEQCDFVVGAVTGRCKPETMARSVCAAGHKAMYHPAWGGLPSAAFLESLSPGFSRFRERFAAKAEASDKAAGGLVASWAAKVGLRAGVPVAVGSVDAHLGAVGSGVKPGTLVKAMGTSTCDCMVWPSDAALPDIEGVSGIVPDSIVPGMFGIEAGQAAVGDIFNWFVQRMAPSGYGNPAELHESLTRAAEKLRPGESGLLALDWHNGNRCVLADPLLTGLVVGETLATMPHEVYRALIEATAFGARAIIDRIESCGVRVDEVVTCGGIAEKSPFTMQVYADITNRPIKVSRSAQSCALGAAVFGAVVGGAHADVPTAQRAMTGVKSTVYRPRSEAVRVYESLYRLYLTLQDAFAGRGGVGVGGVMKELIRIRQAVREGR